MSLTPASAPPIGVGAGSFPEYSEMGKLQDVVRTLRHAGAVVNSSCGMHVHVDASKHTPQSLKNALSIMYSKEDILFKALNVDERRVERWCQKVREPMLEKIRRLPTNTTMDRLKREWYEEHYNWTRYYALNLHSVFYRGTLEWRCFESTLHAGKVRANITLALAISAQAINQKRTVMRKTEISENPAFTFRTFLLHQSEADGDAENRDQREPRLHLPHLSFAPWPHRAGVQKCAGTLTLKSSRRQGLAV